jgi:NAD(P)-dependent dehydrogenase (short-subunit alcohol dehydrogenase family)
MKLKSSVAVVTGGAVRLGKVISLALAAEGCHILIHYGKSTDQARETMDLVTELGVNAAIHQADLSNFDEMRTIIPSAISNFGKVDILINNGAVFLPGDLDETTEDAWDKQQAINLKSPFFLCQDFSRQIPKDGKGAIVNITDARVYRPAADHVAYRLTKAALITMTETLAHDLAPRITVNALALGAILPPAGKGEDHLLALSKSNIPLRIPGNSGIVADNIIHLLRQDFITGETIRIDGGEFL